MQTAAPIDRITLSHRNRPLAWLFSLDASNDIDIDPPYQRGLVWGVSRKRKLIRSLLEGVPVPSLIINDRLAADFHDPTYTGREWAYAVIDGKQRVSALLGFYRDEFAVPASWLRADRVESTVDTEDGLYVLWSGLSVIGHRMLSNIVIGVAEAQFPTIAAEREIFDRVNFGGVAQGNTDDDL